MRGCENVRQILFAADEMMLALARSFSSTFATSLPLSRILLGCAYLQS